MIVAAQDDDHPLDIDDDDNDNDNNNDDNGPVVLAEESMKRRSVSGENSETGLLETASVSGSMLGPLPACSEEELKEELMREELEEELGMPQSEHQHQHQSHDLSQSQSQGGDDGYDKSCCAAGLDQAPG